jgi:hypothetical protein
VTGKSFVGTNTSGNCLGTKKDSKLKLNANARSVFRVDTRKHAGAFRYKDTRWGAWSAEMTPHEVKPKPKVLKASKVCFDSLQHSLFSRPLNFSWPLALLTVLTVLTQIIMTPHRLPPVH